MNVGGPKRLTDAIKAAGGQVGPRSYWAGAWMLKSGYGGLDSFYAGCKADGAQPLVLVWPIGDDDGRKFLTTGVMDQYQGVFKTRQHGLDMTREVARRAKAAGLSPIIVLNNEFNKAGMTANPDFAKFYDEQVAIIRAECPTAKIVFPPGAWGDLSALVAYYRPQVEKSDMVGVQCGYFHPRNPTAKLSERGAALTAAFSKLGTTKPRILYDVFLSSYGGSYSPTHPFPGGDGRALESEQAAAISSLKNVPNLTAIVYRDLKDAPTFDVKNWGGYAERHVGVVRADGTRKPGYEALMALARALNPSTDPEVLQRELDALRAAYAAAQANLAALQVRLDEADRRHVMAMADLAVWQAKVGALKTAIQAAMDSVN